MLCSLHQKLDDQALQSIQNLEKELNTMLLAFTCHDVKPSMLGEKELQKIQKLEKDLGISLVAVMGN
jgi:hypothetical protein